VSVAEVQALEGVGTRSGRPASREARSGWRISEQAGVLTLRLNGDFHLGTDINRLVGVIDPYVQDRDEIHRVSVDVSALEYVPAALRDTVVILDRQARLFDKTVDLQVPA
jgi:hypothetical protein